MTNLKDYVMTFSNIYYKAGFILLFCNVGLGLKETCPLLSALYSAQIILKDPRLFFSYRGGKTAASRPNVVLQTDVE
jgi:hypothetical protein